MELKNVKTLSEMSVIIVFMLLMIMSIVSRAEVNSYDNIGIAHEIRMCYSNIDKYSGDLLIGRCGVTAFSTDYIVDNNPLITVITNRPVIVNVNWYHEGKLLSSYEHDDDNNRMYSYVTGIDKIGIGTYYADITINNFGNARVVFYVSEIGSENGETVPVFVSKVNRPIPTLIPTPTPKPTYVYKPVYVVPTSTEYVPEVGKETGCLNSAYGFGICAGQDIAKVGAGIVVGIAKGIFSLLS